MAATSVLRLKVDDKEYNASLRQAQQGMQHLEQALQTAGKTFAQVDKSVVEYARAIGQMETQSKTARGKIGEMTSAFVELSTQYNKMSAEMKNTDVGRALAQSMDELRQRTVAAKQELQQLNAQLAETKVPDMDASGGSLLSGLGGKFSGAMQVFAGNMMTKATGAIANLGSEMLESIHQGVELARQGEGIRIAFERLGRGDILDGLRQATHGTVTDIELMKAAVKFNDFKLPLDELGTMLAFAQQKAKDTGQSVDYMVDSIVTGLGRKSLMILDNLGLSATEVKDKMAETGDMTKAVGAIIREQMSKAGDYVETAADRAAQANVSLQNKMEELGRKFAPLQEASDNMWTSMKIGIMDVIGGPLTDLLNKLTEAGRLASAYGVLGGNAKVGRMTANLSSAREGNRQSIYQQQQQQFWKYINPREQQIRDIRAWQSGQRGKALQGRINAITEKYGSLDVTKIQAEVDAAKKMLADYQSAAKQILQPIKQEITPAITTSGGTTGGRGGGSSSVKLPTFEDFQKQFAKVDVEKLKPEDVIASQSVWEEYADGIRKSFDIGGDDTIQTFDGIKDSMDRLIITSESYKKAQEDIAQEEAARITRQKQLKDAQNLGAQAAINFGAALASMEDPAAKAAGTVMQAIASIALGFAQASATASELGPWGWVAFLAAGAAAMATTISTVHSLTGYAQGGVIKGNSYSGDNIGGMVDGGAGGFVGLNAGEVVLNAAQQRGVASALSEGGNRRIEVFGRLSGETIYLSSDRYTRRTGRGTIMTWK